MVFDSSRFTFDPLKDYSGVAAQQGRLQLDSEWNEHLAESDRRVRAGFLDILGPAAVPSTTPGGFRLEISQGGGADLTIGRGRMYVDGIPAENHGLAPQNPKWVPPPEGAADPQAPAGASWDPSLAELFGPDTAYSFLNQPYLPPPGASNAPALPTSAGTYLFYLDVWRREVTYLQEPDLVEKALGTDTAGRLQTVWQVKYDGPIGNASTDCSTDPRSLLANPPASRLTTGTVAVDPDSVSCLAPPGDGYKGLDNRLYRVEIHQSGVSSDPTFQATFKWSRDNGSAASAVLAIPTSTSLEVQSLAGPDGGPAFNAGDWVEVTDDFLELSGQPGEMHKVSAVDAVRRVLTLATPLSGSFDATDAQRHTRARRWDQKGKVYQPDGTLYWDLDNPPAGTNPVAPGAIPVPAAGVSLVLENALTVAFDLDTGISATPAFAAFDYWTFAARFSDGTVEKLAQAPARGIHHHYANLALVTFDGSGNPTHVDDCRTAWPFRQDPPCCCSIQVSPADLEGGTTLQEIADSLVVQGSTGNFHWANHAEICLAAGTYCLEEPLRLTANHATLTLKGCPGAVLAAAPGSEAAFLDGMVVVTGGGDFPLEITLREIEFSLPGVLFQPLFHPDSSSTQAPVRFAGLTVDRMPGVLKLVLDNKDVPYSGSIGVRAVNCDGLTVEDCRFAPSAQAEKTFTLFWAGLFAQGRCDRLRVEGNAFQGLGTFAVGFLQAPSVAFNEPADAETFVSEQARFSLEGGKVLASALDHASFLHNDFGTKLYCASLFQPHLAAAALALGRTAEAVFRGNEVGNSNAGFWVISPLMASPLAYDLFVLQGSILSMSYPLPAGVQGADITLPDPLGPALVFAGTSTASSISDAEGTWLPDETPSQPVSVSGGTAIDSGVASPIVAEGDDPALYHSVREANLGNDITYTFDPGSTQVSLYQVRLKFMEYFEAAKKSGQRVMDVAINGLVVLSEFDVATRAGGDLGSAVVMDFDNVPLVNGQVVVKLSTHEDPSTGIKQGLYGPIVTALEFKPEILVAPKDVNPAQSLFRELLVLAQLAFPGLSPQPAALDLAVEDNDVSTELLPALEVTGSPYEPQPSLLTAFANTFQQFGAEVCSATGVTDDTTINLSTATVGLWGLGSASLNGNQILNHVPSSSFPAAHPRMALYYDSNVNSYPVVGNVLRGGMPNDNVQYAPDPKWCLFNRFFDSSY